MFETKRVEINQVPLASHEMLLYNIKRKILIQNRPQDFRCLSSDSVRLETEHDSARRPRRIFPLSSTGDVHLIFRRGRLRTRLNIIIILAIFPKYKGRTWKK